MEPRLTLARPSGPRKQPPAPEVRQPDSGPLPLLSGRRKRRVLRNAVRRGRIHEQVFDQLVAHFALNIAVLFLDVRLKTPSARDVGAAMLVPDLLPALLIKNG